MLEDAGLESERIPWENRSKTNGYRPSGFSTETLKSASAHLGAGKTSDRAPTSWEEFQRASRPETIALYQWAKHEGRLIEAASVRRVARAFSQKGTEHEVYLDEPSNRFVKVGLEGFGKTPRIVSQKNDFRALAALPSEYIKRFILYNDFFGDDVRLHGVIREGENIFPVISQPAIDGEGPGYREIVKFMKAEGFRRVGLNEWFHDLDGISVTDANPANFKIDHHGGVLPIDVGITKPEGDLLRVLSHILLNQGPEIWLGEHHS